MALLETQGISKAFPGVQALVDVDFSLEAGEIHALMGENGAGKSSLIKVITGVYRKDGGTLFLDGQPANFPAIQAARQAGLVCVFQEVNLVPNLSVAHNLFLGREPMRFGCINHQQMRRDARDILRAFNLDIDAGLPLGRFSLAVQQLVAIARGVSSSARVLILDEPTASLDSREVDILFGILGDLRARGLAIVFVSHFLDQVYRLCDRITILRNGRRAGTWPVSELSREALVAQMLGRSLEATDTATKAGPDAAGEPWLRAEGISVRRTLAPSSLSIHRGEAVGLAGLLGSGRTEVCRALFGLYPLAGGSIAVAGMPGSPRSPIDAIRHGMALCPEDRKAEGIIGPLSVADNMVLARQAKRGWTRRLPASECTPLVEGMINDLGIKVADSQQPVEQLSGGNQQKVILARALLTAPCLIILDEPTRGIDVGAHAEIIRLIRQLRDQGMAVLVTSSELEELIRFADRVVVMRDRQTVSELAGDAINESAIMAAIAAPGDHHEAA